MAIDVARARAETPGCSQVLHFNNAGASLMPQVVLDAQVAHLQREAAIGGYESKAEAVDAIEGAYASIARLLNCRAEEIALMENATVAWHAAFLSLPWQEGDRILTAEAEYASNYISYLKLARQKGVVVERVPSTATGDLDVEALERMIDGRVRLVAVTHVPTNGGLVNPAAEIGRIAKAHNILFLLDACQSAGQLDLDVQAIGCDLLSATGRKYLRGPRGSGFLYVRKERLEEIEPPVLDLHSAHWVAPERYEMRPDARRFENWEFNYAAVLGLGAAVDYALAWGMPEIERRVVALAADLRTALAEVPGVTVQDIGTRKCGICTFTHERLDAATISARLRAQAINTSVSDPNSTLLDATARGLPDLVRASVHYFNTDEEIDRFCRALLEL